MRQGRRLLRGEHCVLRVPELAVLDVAEALALHVPQKSLVVAGRLQVAVVVDGLLNAGAEVRDDVLEDEKVVLGHRDLHVLALHVRRWHDQPSDDTHEQRHPPAKSALKPLASILSRHPPLAPPPLHRLGMSVCWLCCCCLRRWKRSDCCRPKPVAFVKMHFAEEAHLQAHVGRHEALHERNGHEADDDGPDLGADHRGLHLGLLRSLWFVPASA